MRNQLRVTTKCFPKKINSFIMRRLNIFTIEMFALLRCLSAWICSYSPTFRNNLSVLSSIQAAWPLKMAQICCPETSVNNYQSTQCNTLEERRSHLHIGGSNKSHIFTKGQVSNPVLTKQRQVRFFEATYLSVPLSPDSMFDKILCGRNLQNLCNKT